MIASDTKRELILNIKNIPGWRTGRKIVVFISDDWGDLRIRSDEDYQNLIEYGIPLDRSPHTRYETLATHQDLSTLYEVLNSVQDKNGNPAVFSPFVIMANPDFKKIRESDYMSYHYEVFTDTILKKEDGQKTIDAWNEGIQQNLFIPELHGRDHINVPLWLRFLKTDDALRFAFRYHYAYLKTGNMPVSPHYGFYFDSEEDKLLLKESLIDGVKIFTDVFNKSPKVFNPPNGMFHQDFYSALVAGNIYAICANHFREQPDGKGAIKKKYYRFGEVSKEGVVHFISNCAFEPVTPHFKGTKETLRQISIAFRWKKPALINTHRVNYVGGRNTNNRDKGLNELSELLNSIVKKWPDAEFMSAREFADILINARVDSTDEQ